MAKYCKKCIGKDSDPDNTTGDANKHTFREENLKLQKLWL